MRTFPSLCVAAAFTAHSTSAAEPVFTHIHPAGLQVGTRGTVALTGTFDPWPCRVFADAAGLTFAAEKEKGTFTCTVEAGVPPGPHLLRAYNAEGASAPVAVMVTRGPQTRETEPNDDFSAPQVLESGTATINGQLLKPDDVDSFQVSLTKGRTLVARVEAYVLAAGFDAMLRITDSRGVTLAFDHDGPSNMDPFLAFSVPEDGDYVVQVMGHQYPASSDIRFAGGRNCVYRLHLSTGPVVRHAWPLAISEVAGAGTEVAVEGWNLENAKLVPGPFTDWAFPVVHSSIPELVESAEPLTLTIPSAVSGHISTTGEEDRYGFAAVKGEVVELVVSGPAQGSEMDPWMKILDEAGKQLATNDDAGGAVDSRLVWTAPADGVFTAVVGDLTQRAGDEYYYRLSLTHPEPSVSATVTGHSVKLPAGSTVEVRVNVVRANGHAAPLKVTARHLPAGVRAADGEVPEKGGEVVLKLTAETGAAQVSQPFLLKVVEGGRDREFPVNYVMISTSENNGVPNGYRELLVNETSGLWLTVTPSPTPAPPPATPPPG